MPLSHTQLGALLSGLVTVLVPTLQFPNIVSLFGRTLLLIVLGFFPYRRMERSYLGRLGVAHNNLVVWEDIGAEQVNGEPFGLRSAYCERYLKISPAYGVKYYEKLSPHI